MAISVAYISELMEQEGRFKRHHLTIDLLNSLKIILWQLKIVRFHVLIEWSHDGTGIIGVFKA